MLYSVKYSIFSREMFSIGAPCIFLMTTWNIVLRVNNSKSVVS